MSGSGFKGPRRQFGFIGAVIGAIGSIAGGLLASKGAKAAADASAEAARLQVEEARRQYDVTRADLSPFRLSGYGANNLLTYINQPDAPNPKRLGRYDAFGREAEALRAELGLAPTGQAQAGLPNSVAPGSAAPGARETLYNYGWGPAPTIPSYAQVNHTATAGGTPGAATLTDAQRKEKQARLAWLEKRMAKMEPNLGKRGKKNLVTDFLRQTPGYQFRFDEGQKAVERSALTGGRGGRTMKALQRYGQDSADAEFSNWVNRLQWQTSLGENAAVATGNAGANSSGQVINALGNYGNARAAGYAGQADAWGNALDGVGYSVGRGLDEYYANKAKSSPSSGTSSGSSWSGGGF